MQLTTMKVWGKEGKTKVFSGPVQKHLTSFRAQEGRFTSHDLGSAVLLSHKLWDLLSHPLGLCFQEFSAEVNKYRCNPLR